MAKKARLPSEELAGFLNFVDQCCRDCQYASDIVGEEDRRLQDLVHEMEFARDAKERGKVAARLQDSRKLRRRNKDIVKQNEQIVRFFEDPENKRTLNRMRQLLGRQRKEEEFLASDRVYKPRAG